MENKQDYLVISSFHRQLQSASHTLSSNYLCIEVFLEDTNVAG